MLTDSEKEKAIQMYERQKEERRKSTQERRLERRREFEIEKGRARTQAERDASLSPCPFCGEKATFYRDDNGDYPDVYRIECTFCPGNVSGCATPEEAIKAWNARVQGESKAALASAGRKGT